MTQEQAETLARLIRETCPAIATEVVPHGATFQVWIWSARTRYMPVVLESRYDWIRTQTYRDLFAIADAARGERIEAAARAALAHLNWLKAEGALTREDEPAIEALSAALA